MGGFAIPIPQRLQLITGQIVAAQAGGITITFPSARFCKNYVTDDFLNAILNKICGQATTYKGNGEVDIGTYSRCGHVKLTGGEGVGWDWGPGIGNASTIFIRGYGEKGGRGAKGSRSGGYTWET